MGDPVTFSIATGDLESVRYLWQFEPITHAIVKSDKFADRFPTLNFTSPASYPDNIPSGSYKWAMKLVAGDAGDLTEAYSIPLLVGESPVVKRILQGQSKISINNEQKLNIIDAKVSKNSKYKYKIDYNIGDLVWVAGNYEAASIMRVTEHAQILDETGESSIPTLSPW
jgi:hypothetical protein